MSYSYIKSVFPKFENSNKVYDESLYPSEQSQTASPVSTSQSQTTSLVSKSQTQTTGEPSFLETYKNVLVDDYASFALDRPESQNNLTYKNLPIQQIPKQPELTEKVTSIVNVPQTPFQPSTPKVVQYKQSSEIMPTGQPLEAFTNESHGDCALNCDSYIRHISECGRCKAILLKQFGIETDRIRTEEILELISYIIFGLFILLLLDYLKRNK